MEHCMAPSPTCPPAQYGRCRDSVGEKGKILPNLNEGENVANQLENICIRRLDYMAINIIDTKNETSAGQVAFQKPFVICWFVIFNIYN